MTAELADVFNDKTEGVLRILNIIEKLFPREKIRLYSVDNKFLSFNEALKNPRKLAAANWIATGHFFSETYENCLIIDMGSTTTDFIIILNGKLANKGVTDLERLVSGELYYSGMLRTPICAVANNITFNGEKTNLAAELFSIIADAHLILGNIKEEDYTCETPDGRIKTKKYSFSRLSKMLCSDLEEISETDLISLAKEITRIQLNNVKNQILKIVELHPQLRKSPLILTGIGERWLYKNLVKELKELDINTSDVLLKGKIKDFNPSHAVAFLLNRLLEESN
jgi:probable H4MPT-linked C1 transfer pathway protein